ncbi:MAG: substrate-binding domain-containing protein [Pseudomonadota bacterium]
MTLIAAILGLALWGAQPEANDADPYAIDAMLAGGTGDGLRVQAGGVDPLIADLCSDASVTMVETGRRITEAELGACLSRGVGRISEIPLGIEALILAQAGNVADDMEGMEGLGFGLDLRELFLASALLIPEDDACTLVPNPHTRWSDVRTGLPDRPIRIFGPGPGERARQQFIDRALIEGARQIDCLAELERRDPAAFVRATLPRGDEVWLEIDGTGANLAGVLARSRGAIGIVGWQQFNTQPGLRALALGGVVPNQTTLGLGRYPLSQARYLYTTPEGLQDPSVQRLLVEGTRPGTTRPVRHYGTGNGAPVSEIVETSRSRVRVYRAPE